MEAVDEGEPLVGKVKGKRSLQEVEREKGVQGGGEVVKRSRKRHRVRKKKGEKSKVIDGVEDDDEESGTGDTGETSGVVGKNLERTDTIYVEGIPWTCNEEDVKRFFKDCGTITSVRLPRWQDSGRARGYAHVVFESPAGAQAAFAKDGQYLNGRYLTVQAPQAPQTVLTQQANRTAEHPEGCRTVFIKNIPYDADEDGVAEALEACGKVASVRLAMWGHTHKLKGFGYVEFVTERGAEKAVRTQNKLVIGGRPVVVDFETGRPKGSFRSQDGRQIARNASGEDRGGDGKKSNSRRSKKL